jgi:glycosyltransferase involved in cell wall biosynthesis
VFRAVRGALLELEPDVVLAPATPFPEGMAAIAYRNASGARVFMMDDAWGLTDRRGPLVRFVKRLIHRSVDGAFIPGPFHDSYYLSLGFSESRILHGMNAVDNAFYAESARCARERAEEVRARLGLPPRYLLFVGRFLPRKGLKALLAAYASYRRGRSDALPLCLAGGTQSDLRDPFPPGVQVLGRRYGRELGELYGLADALVVPSRSDPWGLVVNEALAAGLPVAVSRGCGASCLVRDGVNGWRFEPGKTDELSAILGTIADLSPDARAQMSVHAQESIKEWGLDRFSSSALKALDIPRATPAAGLAALASRLWRGWVRVY